MTTAAQDLLIHRTEDTAGGGYEPSHPWYYLCGGKIPTAAEIPAGDFPEDKALTGKAALKMRPETRRKVLQQKFRVEHEHLWDAYGRWEEVLSQGIDAVSRHDIETTDHSNPGLALCSALSLAYRNVAASLGKIEAIKTMLTAMWVSRQIREDPLVNLPITRECPPTKPEGTWTDVTHLFKKEDPK